ncbi:hypothetical protein C4K35_5280 [Pseudomonas chlororaphis subsp. piscium]|nr:hypothetical protein C4K35_5280 [Pseudomonas chlororaphis subsp. piscium]AZC65308.1 hypothetical protein C4K33_4839 [Pseudomonas chlororaphis subsp. piscium]AZC71548.1 hypothetical protein C4K32_4909 [Pseudomonas chlororaphis subsp. piscium]AZC77781.1 hypothetical protein C4K31_4901 [Pseudomonas chlororaphis subsp. piscium]AZC84103.1 hypothetical protein C4K30_5012 [Pseudomonas chlororaphis subsp. piscium]
MPEEMFYPGHPYRGQASLLQKIGGCRSEACPRWRPYKHNLIGDFPLTHFRQ